MITLKKIPPHKIILLNNIMVYYIQVLDHDKPHPLEKMFLSVAEEIYYKMLQTKINKRPQSNKTTLKLPYHYAYTLTFAFENYIMHQEPNDLDAAIISNFKLELFKQML